MSELYRVTKEFNLEELKNKYKGIKNNSKDNFFENYKVSKGDTLYQLSKKNNIELSCLLKINGLEENDHLYPDQNILIPKEETKIYVVGKNETINEISERTKISVECLLENNNPYLLPNQIIIYKRD